MPELTYIGIVSATHALLASDPASTLRAEDLLAQSGDLNQPVVWRARTPKKSMKLLQIRFNLRKSRIRRS
jgi:hypothetical protein